MATVELLGLLQSTEDLRAASGAPKSFARLLRAGVVLKAPHAFVFVLPTERARLVRLATVTHLELQLLNHALEERVTGSHKLVLTRVNLKLLLSKLPT